jgi:hypothetical protein
MSPAIVGVVVAMSIGWHTQESTAQQFKYITGQVDSVRMDALTGFGIVTWGTNATVIGPTPACVNPVFDRSLSFNVNTVPGRAIFEMAVAAKANSKGLAAYGTGTCGTYSIVEDWYYGYLAS